MRQVIEYSTKLVNLAIKDDFLRSSSFIFISNIFVAALNYILLFLVSTLLPNDVLSSWTALNSIILVLFSPLSGINIHVAKRVSKLSQKSEANAYSYLNFIRKKTKNIVIIGLLLTPLFGFIGRYYFFSEFSVVILTLVFISIFLQYESSISNYFLMGSLKIQHYVTAVLISNISKFIVAATLIFSGVEEVTVPIMLIVQSTLLFIISQWYINKNKPAETEEVSEVFSIKEEILNVSKTVYSLSLLAMFIHSGSIISNEYLQPLESDIFAVIFNSGQTIFFGSTAALTALVSQSARTKNLKIYFQSLGIVVLITTGISVSFLIIGEFLLTILNRSDYTEYIPLILLYAVFVGAYNIVFVSVQYPISRTRYLPIFISTFFLGLMVTSLYLTGKGIFILFDNILVTYITGNIVITSLTAIFLILSILKISRQSLQDIDKVVTD